MNLTVIKLNPADFADHTVVDLGPVEAGPREIEAAAMQASRGGVGHVFIAYDERKPSSWTPSWRELKNDQPPQPRGFPEVQVGYGHDMADVIAKFRFFARQTWRDVPRSSSGQALVFDSAEDAAEFLMSVGEHVA